MHTQCTQGVNSLVHYTLLLQNQGGYYNSLILKALDLPPRECNKKKSPRINLNRSEKNEH